MGMEIKTPSLVYEVCFGAVFKITHNGKRVLALSKRDREGHWLAAFEIDDEPGVYKNLGIDQCAIVRVESKDSVIRLKDVYALTLDESGDTTTVGRAVKDKVLGRLLEKSFQGWLKDTGPLLDINNTTTALYPHDLHARYEFKDKEALRLAWAREYLEDRGHEDDVYKESVNRFNTFLSHWQIDDELYWFSTGGPLSLRAGYVILRCGKVVALRIELMS